MALSKASALFSSRVITTGQCMTPPLARRWLFDFGKSSEALFTEVDVIPSDERFLKPLSVKDYERMDDSLYRPLFVTPGPFYKRLATIVPLYDMKKTIVVPIPCVIDTGAPAFLLLGTAARNALFHHKLLRGELTQRLLEGILIKNGREILNPIVAELPYTYEDERTRNDVRYNVLGIYGLQQFGYVIDFNI